MEFNLYPQYLNSEYIHLHINGILLNMLNTEIINVF